MLLMILKDVISPFQYKYFHGVGTHSFSKKLRFCKELGYSSIKKPGFMKFKN